MKQPVLLILLGHAGTGKTTIAQAWQQRMAGRMEFVTASDIGQAFECNPDWKNIDCVCIDEVSMFEKVTALAGIRRLYLEAATYGKKLLLVLQSQSELKRLGFEPPDEPAVVEIKGRQVSVVFSYSGGEIAFP
jgi:chromosomal replication initiation ATPase DnaA